MKQENNIRLAVKYKVSERTIRGWRKLAMDRGERVPWENGPELLEWFRAAFGKDPKRETREAMEEVISDQLSVISGRSEEVPSGREVINDQLAVSSGGEEVKSGGDVNLLEKACADLGLAETLARIVQEEQEAWEIYRKAKERGISYDKEGRNWKEATELKRAVHKTPDAVEVATALVRSWVRSEWEQRWKKLRIELSGNRLGLTVRDDLMRAGSETGYVSAWDKAMELVVLESAE